MNGGNDSIETHNNSSRINAGSSMIKLMYFVTIKKNEPQIPWCMKCKWAFHFTNKKIYILKKARSSAPLCISKPNRQEFTRRASHVDRKEMKICSPYKNERKEKGGRKLVRVYQASHFYSNGQVVFPHRSEKTAGFTTLPNACLFPTQAHWKYVSLHTFLQQRNYVPCSTFRGSFKVKCPESGAKTHV